MSTLSSTPKRTPSSPLLARSWLELFQTERSAERHPQVEADRLGTIPPADALRLVSAHATRALGELTMLARARGHEDDTAGEGVGQMFSVLRERVADLALSNETSYRATLLGIRHGIDLMRMLAAATADDPEFNAWCKEWLGQRVQLAVAVESELGWFAQHPDVALAPVDDSTLGRIAKKIGSPAAATLRS